MTTMFNPKNMYKHLGTDIKLRDRLTVLETCEEYFIEKCKRAGIEYSLDCTANERSNYKTLNYTNYAGMFIMHPLCYSESVFQMYDAIADKAKPVGHCEWLKTNIDNKYQGKYVKPDNSELQLFDGKPFTHLAVLAGSNKFLEFTSRKKFLWICANHQTKLVLKPHPITDRDCLNHIKQHAGSAQIADKHDDLYDLIARSKTVYTTHISETALTSLLMGKKVSPLDPYAIRLTGSFSHINNILFRDPKPLKTINSVFASPKSGVLHPHIDDDWRGKMDAYFDYTLAARRRQKQHYFE